MFLFFLLGHVTKTAKPFKVPFGMWTQVGPRYRVLDGDVDPPGEGAILEGHIPAHCKLGIVECEPCRLIQSR